VTPSHPSAPVLAVLFGMCAAQAASAQSLADIARREQERRKQVTADRVFTNDDLARIDAAPSTSTVEAAPSAGVSPGGTANGTKGQGEGARTAQGTGTVIEGRPKRDEKYWRERARDLRGRLAHATAGIAAAESRLAELEARPPTPANQRERELAAAALARLRAGVQSLSGDIDRMMARAQIENVPSDWVR